ncbi:MAG TPA: hypothetical protein VNO30_36080 [Kofleriaceae bacterium]|nr:hypothetical protein [Kofleriaceae bacterium]
MEIPTSFELTFRPDLELVTDVRTFVEQLYQRVLHDKDLSGRLAIATHELLENAVKYSLDGETSLRIDVAPTAGAPAIAVRTRNRAEARHVTTLRGYLDEMRASDDPTAYYLTRMRRAAGGTHVSQLGLARIRCEAEMQLSCSVEGDTVTVQAETLVS